MSTTRLWSSAMLFRIQVTLGRVLARTAERSSGLVERRRVMIGCTPTMVGSVLTASWVGGPVGMAALRIFIGLKASILLVKLRLQFRSTVSNSHENENFRRIVRSNFSRVFDRRV